MTLQKGRPLRKRMPAPWWAAAILALAWLLFSSVADAATSSIAPTPESALRSSPAGNALPSLQRITLRKAVNRTRQAKQHVPPPLGGGSQGEGYADVAAERDSDAGAAQNDPSPSPSPKGRGIRSVLLSQMNLLQRGRCSGCGAAQAAVPARQAGRRRQEPEAPFMIRP